MPTLQTGTPMFSPDKLAAAIAQVIPAEKRNSYSTFVVGTVDQQGAQIVVAVTKSLKDGAVQFEASAAARYDWTGNKGAGAKLLVAFK